MMRTVLDHSGAVDPGVVFIDADGLAWVALNPQPRDDEPMAQFVWFTPDSKGIQPDEVLAPYLLEVTGGRLSYIESDPSIPIPIRLLRTPFIMKAELSDGEPYEPYDAVAQMADPERYAALRALTFAERHPCPVTDCRLSAEEHHRLAFGMIAENRELKRRVQALENGGGAQ